MEVQRRFFFFFKLGIVGVKAKSWNQEVDKEAIGMSRGAEKPPKPVKLLCVSVNVCVLVNVSVCVCEKMEQLQGTSVAHNKAIHLVYDSFNRHVPLMLFCRRRCIIVRET